MGIVIPAMPVGNNVSKSDDKEKLDWQNIDIETLSKEHGHLLIQHLTSLAAAEKTKQAFEKPFRDACEISEGHQLVFSYKRNRANEWEVRVAEAPIREGKGKVSAASLYKKAKK